MPSKKQRRRREKSLRHEYEYVYVDEEGHEVEVEDDPEQAKAKDSAPRDAGARGARNGNAKSSARTQPQRGSRAQRKVDPPSWRRVGRRALIFAPLMLVVVSLLNRNQTFAEHAVQTVFLLAFFLPFSYVMDTIMYRTYRRRMGDAPEPRSKRGRRL